MSHMFRNKIYICLLILLYICSSLNGQDPIEEKQKKEADLLQKIEETSNDSLKMEYYNQLRRLVTYDDPQKNLTYTKAYGKLAEKLGYKLKIGLAKFYEANAYVPMGNNEEALKSLLEAEEIFTSLSDHSKLISVINSIGAVYEGLNLDKEALRFFQRSLDLAISISDKRRQGIALNNISNIHFRAGNYTKSKNALDSVYKISEALDDQLKEILDLNYANTLMGLKLYQKAQTLYDKILKSKNQDNAIISRCYFGLGKIKYFQDDLEMGLKHFKKAKSIAINNSLTQISNEIDEWIVKCYETKTDFQKAYIALKDSKLLSDSMHNIEVEEKVVDALKKYEAEKLEQEIKVLTLENEVNSLNLKKTRQLSLIFIVVALLLGLLAFLAWRLKNIKTKNNIELTSKNQQISKALEEKNILLREIHHRVKNNLQVISSLLKLQSQYIEDEGAVKAIAEGRNRVHSMALLHQNLYKEDNLTGVNMKEYFTNLIEGLFDAYKITDIKLVTEIEDLTLDIDTVIPLGLIANELVSNALKHAFEKVENGVLTVKLWEKDGHLLFNVKDNGNGYDKNLVAEGKKSFGQKLIKSLSDKLEADIQVTTTSGTNVTLSIKDYKKVG